MFKLSRLHRLSQHNPTAGSLQAQRKAPTITASQRNKSDWKQSLLEPRRSWRIATFASIVADFATVFRECFGPVRIKTK